MRINTLFYSIKQGFKNIFRNKMFSLASIATMAACIFMFGLFYIVVTNFSSMVKTAEEGVAVTVFFNEGTTEDVIKADKAQSYDKLFSDMSYGKNVPAITDDAMIVEYGSDTKVKLIEGSYENIKVTTPEDMGIAELFLKKRRKM